MGVKYFVPHLSVFGVPLISLRAAKRAGADGVEIHLVAKTMAQALRVAKHAKSLGLGVNWHQGWSREEDYAKLPHNKVLDILGQLPRSGYSLEGHIPPTDDPAVVYVERIGEIGPNKHWWVQTACNFAHPRALTFEKFLGFAEELDLGIVFDVQHVLEWIYRKQIADLPQNSAKLGAKLEYTWRKLHEHGRVKEIHFTDTDPRLGNNAGRNLFFGKGILPLTDFCAMVRESGWSGVVVPEVRPSDVLWRGASGVLEETKNYFS